MTPAIYIPAKTGDIFVLDRRDARQLVPAPEKPVPQGAAKGDRLSPTQPFSELSFRPPGMLTDAQMWGSTMFDQLACRIKFKRLRYEGPFTPPSEQGTLVFPGDFGMFEWGGIAVDPQRQIAIANPQSIPFVSRLVPRGKDNPAAPNAAHPPGTELGVQPMYGAPYGRRPRHFPLTARHPLPCPAMGQHRRDRSQVAQGGLAASHRHDPRSGPAAAAIQARRSHAGRSDRHRGRRRLHHGNDG
ncbi:glucose dehydrogenase [Bradyrhizobium sp. GM6.1]